jgi:type I restriction-modification system DNA methylase subunit
VPPHQQGKNLPLKATALRPHLEACKYQPELLCTDFRLADGATVSLAAFAQSPADARSACIAVIEADEGTTDLVASCRAIAAPIVFVCGRAGLEWWKQGTAQAERQPRIIPPVDIPKFFKTHADDFAPHAVYRAKTWGRFDEQFQRSFVDLGLMPLVEEQIGESLVQLIASHVQTLKSRLRWDAISERQGQWLLKTVFWLVSAKILHDKQVGQFKRMDLLDAEHVLKAVGEHFDTEPISITSERQRKALGEIAESSLQLATTESLAYVYENTLISQATRQSLSTHSTPSYLVDYIVGRLRPWIAEIPLDQRHVFEPVCGHAAFLVSAMRLLTELLPEEKSSPAQRRRYLRRRIHGCDIDSFALEIARLSLSLTDIPNPDGWDLIAGDMFEGDTLETKARTATVLLANPPFENFSGESRTWYEQRGVELRHVNKTAELLARVLPELPSGAVLGVVVPQGFLHSKNATSVRRLLTTDFELQEICLFPDKVFTFSDMESAVLIARKKTDTADVSTDVRYRRVRERGMDAFRQRYSVMSESMVEASRFGSEASDLRVAELREVWEHCGNLPRFQDIAEIGQGLSYKSADLPRNANTFSEQPFSDATRGFVWFDRDVQLHELPRSMWMNLDKEVIQRERHGTKVGTPQVLLNQARIHRGTWRLKALLDCDGHPVTSRFEVVRSKLTDDALPLEWLWALCNSPFANSFAFDSSNERANDVGIFQEMPVPRLNSDGVKRVVAAARKYLDYVRRDPAAILQRPVNPQKARALLLRVDCEVLRMYDLPRELEWQLLNFFAGWLREGVPFKFDRYFPEGFEDHLTLAEYLAITEDWPETNERREELIHKKVARQITLAERAEFEHLQFLAGARQNLIEPLPLKELEALHRELMREAE